MTIHVSLERANLKSCNISAPEFCIWQHIGHNWSTMLLQKLANVLEIPITQLYSHQIGQSKPILPSQMNRSSEEEGPSLVGKFLTHPGTYMGFLGMVFIASMGVYCLKKFCVDLLDQGANSIPKLHGNMPLWMMMWRQHPSTEAKKG